MHFLHLIVHQQRTDWTDGKGRERDRERVRYTT